MIGLEISWAGNTSVLVADQVSCWEQEGSARDETSTCNALTLIQTDLKRYGGVASGLLQYEVWSLQRGLALRLMFESSD